MSEQGCDYEYKKNQVIAGAGWVTFQEKPQRPHLTIKGAPGSDAVYEALYQFKGELGLSQEHLEGLEVVGNILLKELIAFFTTGGIIDKQARKLVLGEAFTQIRPIFDQNQLQREGIISTKLREMRKRANEEGIQLNGLFPAEEFGDTTGILVVSPNLTSRIRIDTTKKYNYLMMQLLDDSGNLKGGSELGNLCEIFGARLKSYLKKDERTAGHVGVVSRPGLVRQMVVDIVNHRDLLIREEV